MELAEAADVRAREQTRARRKTRIVAMRAHDGRHGADDDPRLLVRVHYDVLAAQPDDVNLVARQPCELGMQPAQSRSSA